MSSFRNLKGFDAGPLAAALAAAGMLACSGFLYSALITNALTTNALTDNALRSNALAAGGSVVGHLNGPTVETTTRGDCANAVCLADNWQPRQ